MKKTFIQSSIILFSSLFFLFNLSAHAQVNHVVISQVFGAGGVSASNYDNDFVELYNPTGSSQPLSGWTLQYSGTPTSTNHLSIPLSGSIPAKSYFLIKLGRNSVSGIPLPAADITHTTLNISNNAKVGLVNSTTSLTGNSNPAAASVDYVGIGTSAQYEGAAAPAGSSSTSVLRKASSASTDVTLATGGSEATAGNAYDTDNNFNDFVVQSNVLARNSGVTVLPVSFTGISAAREGNNVRVQWTVAGENNILHYVVERSADGRFFNAVGEVTATGAVSYNWVDVVNFAKGYYRIVSVQASGGRKYSSIVQLKNASEKEEIVLYPNPVINPNITVQFSNQSKQTFNIRLFNSMGQELFTTRIGHTGGSSSHTMPIGALKQKGIYIVRIVSEDGSMSSMPLLYN